MAPATDETTRRKLLEAAAAVFCEQGYQTATIREICTRAEANVAAVNYHFGDKLGLYKEVLRRSLTGVHGKLHESSRKLTGKPEDQLRAFIAAMFAAIEQPGPPSGEVRIMTHELAQPSPALMEVVSEVIGPNYLFLRGLIGRILGLPPEHDVTRLCAHSVIGQVVHYVHARPVIEVLWPGLKMDGRRVKMLASHITEFSLSAIRARARNLQKAERK